MKTAQLPACVLILASLAFAATDIDVKFTLNTTDASGAPIQQNRHYYIYRPDNLPKTTPVPAVLFLEAGPNGPATFFHRKADQAGFVLVSSSFSGNSTGTPGSSWSADNPRTVGFEDYDYLTEVINRVQASDNLNDIFISGFSKGGHMAMAYVCERPSGIKGVSSIDESLLLNFNVPSAPMPFIGFHGTLDTTVSYFMVRDTVDAWRAIDGLWGASPVTTFESSPLIPGQVTQATWRNGAGGNLVAFVTIVGGNHTYATPTIQTGYDCTDGMWTFFSQFLTSMQDAPKIVSQPVNNVQTSGQSASFWVSATGNGPLSYQWQKNGVDIPGATANWYTTPPATLADDGATFRATVSNGSGTATSAAATLKIKAAPKDPIITTQPVDQSVSAGQPATFTVEASGTAPLRYQWKKNGVDIAGATDASLSIPAAITPDSGATFNVVVTSSAGSASSAKASLAVLPVPGAPIILGNPQRPRVVPGEDAIVSVTAWSPSPMSYQWQKGTFTTNIVDILGATESTYAFVRPALTDNFTFLRCVVSNAAGNTTSAGEMLTVTAAPTSPRTIWSPATAYAQAGMPFQFSINSWGGTTPLTFSANPLPAGLSLDPATGQISGTPSDTGTTRMVVDVSNKVGHATSILTLTVTDTPPPVSIDAWRFTNFGSSAINVSIAGDAADPDGDGYTNLDEFNGGSNPLDLTSVPVTRTDNRSPDGKPRPARGNRIAK